MTVVNIHEAKTQLSRLIERVLAGESLVIARAGKPLVRLVPLLPAESAPKGRLGFMRGEFLVPNDFDRLAQDEIAALFDGRS